LLFFTCAMRIQFLTGHVISQCISAVDLTNYVVNLRIPYVIIFPSQGNLIVMDDEALHVVMCTVLCVAWSNDEVSRTNQQQKCQEWWVHLTFRLRPSDTLLLLDEPIFNGEIRPRGTDRLVEFETYLIQVIEDFRHIVNRLRKKK